MAGRDYRYRRQRADLLAGRPLCHWCKLRAATEADHVPPLASAPRPELWAGTLVPACRPCNAARGARFQAERNRRPITTRAWL